MLVPQELTLQPEQKVNSKLSKEEQMLGKGLVQRDKTTQKGPLRSEGLLTGSSIELEMCSLLTVTIAG